MEHILHKTLIIRFSSVGDIVLSSLLLRTLRRRFPDCQIEYLVKAEYADLVRHNPHLSRVIEFPVGGTIRDMWKLRHSVRQSGYDLVIDIHDSVRSRFICLFARNVVRIRKRRIARLLLVRFKLDFFRYFGGAPPIAQRYLEPVKQLGVRDDGGGLEIWFSSKDSTRSEEWLRRAGWKGLGQLIGISPSARHATKIWPTARYAAVAAALARERKATLVLFGGPGEEELCAGVERLIKDECAEARIANLAGKLSLAETAAAIDRCSLVLSNDSGLMHIAAARKRPVVAIFGSTVRQFGFFPFGTSHEVIEEAALSCRPCSHIGRAACPKGHFKCMQDIGVERVLAAARRFLPA